MLLALTGSEAMFAKYVYAYFTSAVIFNILFSSLGQFNAASIRLAFSGFVYPCLILAYLGQGARLIHDGESVFSNIFYLTIPGKTNGPLFWFVSLRNVRRLLGLTNELSFTIGYSSSLLFSQH